MRQSFINWLLFNKIDAYPVISFDIFDTALKRPFMQPSDVFELMAVIYQNKHPMMSVFRNMRQSAEKKARDVRRHNFQDNEVMLDEIYTALQEMYDIPPELCHALINLEKDIETQILQRKSNVYEIYQYCIEKHKKIIFISDMYLCETLLKEILHKNGYDHYDDLFISSTYRQRKHDGKLYNDVTQKYSAASILHIGDNRNGDIKQAKRHKISCHFIPKISDIYLSKRAHKKNWKKNANLENSIHLSAIANYSEKSPSSQFGYRVIGPLLYGFVTWLARKATHHQTDKLFFLSREGHIMKKAYDLIQPYFASPASEYLYASRASTCPAMLRNEDDIIALLKQPIKSMLTISYLFKHRFGLSEDEIQDAAGFDTYFQDWHMPIAIDKYKTQIMHLALSIKDILFKSAQKKRHLIHKYYQDIGLTSCENPAIIDIGYNGSMQKAISNILQKPIVGYYFMTYDKIKCPAYAFYGENIEKQYSKDPIIIKNLFLEMILCGTQETSVETFISKEGQSIPIFAQNNTPLPNWLNGVEEAALAYCQNMAQNFQGFNHAINYSKNFATQELYRFLTKPTLSERFYFSDTIIDNQYFGHEIHQSSHFI